MATIIPANNTRFEVLCVDDTIDTGYRAEPVIAWSVEDDDDGDEMCLYRPTPITATGSHNGDDVALRFPDTSILHKGRWFKDPSGWLFALQK
jgi:hypothetical protein